MTPKVKDLIRQQIGLGQDNLFRAKRAAQGRDPAKQWGESGKTLNDIIAEYEADIKEWEAEING